MVKINHPKIDFDMTREKGSKLIIINSFVYLNI